MSESDESPDDDNSKEFVEGPFPEFVGDDDDEALKDRIETLVAEQARERARLAEKIVLLEMENTRLKSQQSEQRQRDSATFFHLRISPQLESEVIIG